MFKNTYSTAINAMLHPGKMTRKTMSVGDALKFYYVLMIIPMVLGVIMSAAIGSHVSSNPLFGGLAGAMLIILMLLIYLVIIPINIIIASGFYHLIIKRLFKMYTRNYDAAFTAFTYGIIPIALVYWLLPVPVLGFALIAIFSLWTLILEIIAISNQLSMSRLKAFGTLLLEGVVMSIIIYAVIAVGMAAFFSLGLFSSGTFTPYAHTTVSSNTTIASSSNLQSETNLGSATGTYDGVPVQLTIVPQKTVENFPDSVVVGTLYNFSTTNPTYSCLDGRSINVFTAQAEYPGYFVAHNGMQGSQCEYITAIFKR